MTAEQIAGLAARVQQFNLMQLPGQPFGMHMGTSYLVNDLSAEVLRLTATVADLTAANIALVTECARLKAREVEARGLLQTLSRKELSITNDIKSAHSGRGSGAAGWMREDDADFRSDLAAMFAAARAYLAGGA